VPCNHWNLNQVLRLWQIPSLQYPRTDSIRRDYPEVLHRFGMAGLAEKLLNLPAFLLGVLMLYWSVPLSVLLGEIKFWKLHGKRDDAYGW